jgi:hypothetical protein
MADIEKCFPLKDAGLYVMSLYFLPCTTFLFAGMFGQPLWTCRFLLDSGHCRSRVAQAE